MKEALTDCHLCYKWKQLFVVVVVLVFYGPSTLFRSFRTRSVNLPTVPEGSLPVLSVHSFASTWQLPFLNQRKGEIISWPIFTKGCCWMWGSNPRPSAYQVDAHPTKLPHPAGDSATPKVISFQLIFVWKCGLLMVVVVSNWAQSHKIYIQPKELSHVMRKPVYAICEQKRCSSACTSAQSDQRLCPFAAWIV